MSGLNQPIPIASNSKSCEPTNLLVESLQKILLSSSNSLNELSMTSNANSFARKVEINELRNGFVSTQIDNQFKSYYASGGKNYADILAVQLNRRLEQCGSKFRLQVKFSTVYVSENGMPSWQEVIYLAIVDSANNEHDTVVLASRAVNESLMKTPKFLSGKH